MWTIWTKLWLFLSAARMGTRRRYLHRMARRLDGSVTKRPRATLASISESLRRWPIFHSADGRIVSSAIFMVRAEMPLSSTPIRKLWLSAGPRNTAGNSSGYVNSHHRGTETQRKRESKRPTNGADHWCHDRGSSSPRSRVVGISLRGRLVSRIAFERAFVSAAG